MSLQPNSFPDKLFLVKNSRASLIMALRAGMTLRHPPDIWCCSPKRSFVLFHEPEHIRPLLFLHNLCFFFLRVCYENFHTCRKNERLTSSTLYTPPRFCNIYHTCFTAYPFIHPSLYPPINPTWFWGMYFIVSCRHSTLSPKCFSMQIINLNLITYRLLIGG